MPRTATKNKSSDNKKVASKKKKTDNKKTSIKRSYNKKLEKVSSKEESVSKVTKEKKKDTKTKVSKLSHEKVDNSSNKKIVKEDLIITKEIDISELDNYLKEESKEAMDLAETQKIEIDKISDALKKEEMERDEDYQFLIGIDKKDSLNIRKFFLIILIVILIIALLMISLSKISHSVKSEEKIIINTNKKETYSEEMKEKIYNDCMNSSFNNEDDSKEIQKYITELNSYLVSNYNTSIMYYDLSNGFTYKYNEGKVYYAASVIKLLDGLYVYNKAFNNEINLDDKMKYTEEYIYDASKFMSTKQLGEEISIRELVKNAIMVSDNSAHMMLLSYVGKNNLRNYGLSLGATNTLLNDDNFGYIDVKDAFAYLKELYEFINNSGELGLELKQFLVDSEQNDLKIDNIDVATKYGEYDYTYHNIGIVYDEHPYILIVLTEEGRREYEEIVNEISNTINDLHHLYYTNRESVCRGKVN